MAERQEWDDSSLDEATEEVQDQDEIESSDPMDGIDGDEDDSEDEDVEEEDDPIDYRDQEGDLEIDDDGDDDVIEEEEEEGDEEEEEWNGRFVVPSPRDFDHFAQLQPQGLTEQAIAFYRYRDTGIINRPFELRFVDRGENFVGVEMEPIQAETGVEEFFEDLWQDSNSDMASMVAALGEVASVTARLNEWPSLGIGSRRSVGTPEDVERRSGIHSLRWRRYLDDRDGNVDLSSSGQNGVQAMNGQGGAAGDATADATDVSADGEGNQERFPSINRLMQRFATSARQGNGAGVVGNFPVDIGDSFGPLWLSRGFNRGSCRRLRVRDPHRSVPMSIVSRWTYEPLVDGGNDFTTNVRVAGNGKSTSLGQVVMLKVVQELHSMLEQISIKEAKVTREKEELARHKKKLKEAERITPPLNVDSKAGQSSRTSGEPMEVSTQDPAEPSSSEIHVESENRQSPAENDVKTEGMDDEGIVSQSAESASHQADSAVRTEPAQPAGNQELPTGEGGPSAEEGDRANAQESGRPAQERGAPPVAASDSRERFQTVAEERAGQLGISLHAPANTDPAVLQAAVQSTGIDPTFLAALPEDMRTEVLAQHIEQLATGANLEGNDSRNISMNQEFLSALPPDLRAEVLVQDANINARRRQEVEGTDMDNASFLATLSPQLREEILLNADDHFLLTLPSVVSEEARALRQRDRNDHSSNWGLHPRSWQSSLPEANRSPPGFGRLTRISLDHNGRRGSSDWRAGERVRQHPKENEPKPFLDEEGISAVIQLVYYQSSLAKGLMSSVLSSVCKSKRMRKVALRILLDILSTEARGSRGKAPMKPENDIQEKAEFVGRNGDWDRLPRPTVVRRTLELLMSLAEKDSQIARDFVLSDSGEPQEELALNKLLNLISFDLFIRSSAHLEQLVKVLSVVCNSLPNSGREGHRRRGGHGEAHNAFQTEVVSQRIMELGGQEEGESAGENIDMNVLGEDDIAVMNADDPDEDEDGVSADSDEDLYGADDAADGEEDNDAADGVDEGKAEKKIPALAVADLERLAGVISRQGCSDGTYQGVIGILDRLSALPQNRVVAVHALTADASRLGQQISEEFETFLKALETADKAQDLQMREEVLSKFSGCASFNELKLLRIAKTITTLAKTNAEHMKSTFSSLRMLWEYLSRVLDTIKPHEMFANGASRSRSEKHVQMNLNMEGRVGTDIRDDPEGASNAGADQRINGMPDATPQKVGRHNVPPVLARLSPVIQAFFVAHSVEEENEGKGSADLAASSSLPSLQSPKISSVLGSHDSELLRRSESTGENISELGRFIRRHRAAVNMLLRATPSLLEGSFFKSALKYHQWIDFDNKKTYFRNLIKQRTAEANPSQIELCVRREHVFEESYFKLRPKKPEEMKGRLQVRFQDEEGIDAGGVTREWYTILARKIFDANYALFRRSTAKSATYQPNTLSYVNDHHLSFFHFVGRIIGKAIYDGQLLDAYFTRSFYKHILGIPPNYHDLEALEPDYYKSLCWILENDIDGVLDLTFSAEHDDFGITKVVDLIPNGREIPVTNENKKDYVRLITDLRLTKAIKHQIEHFLKGFQELIPREDLKIFNELELELLMSGLPEIDVSDLKANVDYLGYTISSPQINWFWKTVSEMGKEDLARLIMFTTGTSKVPLEGFAALQGMNGLQKFQIHRVAGDSNRLPTAHTCFNQLDLPEYSSDEKLRKFLLMAIREGAEGFGFG